MPSIMAARLLVFLMLLGMAPTAIAEDGSVMRIDHSFTLMEYDPGIEDAAMHPASNWVVVVGAEGYAVSMDKSSPSTMIPLADISDSDLLDSDYHPGGNTALIVGENGSVLRYAISDHSIERATSAQSVGTTPCRPYLGMRMANGHIWEVRMVPCIECAQREMVVQRLCPCQALVAHQYRV